MALSSGPQIVAQLGQTLQRTVILNSSRAIKPLLGRQSSRGLHFSLHASSHPRQRPLIRCWSNSGVESTSRRRYTTSSGTAVLSQTTSFLRNLDNGAEIFLVGTAHVSKQSAQEVRDMITLVKPDSVMIELCPNRAARLRAGQTSNADFIRDGLSQMFAPGTHFGQQLFKLSLQGMYRMLHNIGMDVGGEFKAAMQAAEDQGARLVYGDRDVQETLSKLAAAVQFEDILKMMTHGGPQPPQTMVDFFEESVGGSSDGWNANSRIEAQVEAMKNRGMARQMSEWLRQFNPALAAALIDDRDEHMVRTLRRLNGRVVGVVGLAHLDGIERKWKAMQPGGVVMAPLPRINK